MTMRNVLFLAGYTTRSMAYAQAMEKAQLKPEYVLFFGEESGNLPGQSIIRAANAGSASVFLPDLSESLTETCARYKWDYTSVGVNDVNSSRILKMINQLKPRLIVYSGYGSQIVGEPLIEIGAPIIHMHAGWLPDYRGSTTLYYSWLIENNCCVSAIILNKQIDRGDIIRRKKYPVPPKRVDTDHTYDGAIRADMLVRVLRDYVKNGGFSRIQNQGESGSTYYIIHPILKHIVLLNHKEGTTSADTEFNS